jgi:hypothetical protein
MTHSGKNQDNARKSGGRKERLAAALRENLRKRKAQERGRGGRTNNDAPAEAGEADHGGETR